VLLVSVCGEFGVFWGNLRDFCVFGVFSLILGVIWVVLGDFIGFWGKVFWCVLWIPSSVFGVGII